MWRRKSKPGQAKTKPEESDWPNTAPTADTNEVKAAEDQARRVTSVEGTPVALPASAEAAAPGLALWKMSLLLTGSAFCGGIAVVLWNRRLLTKMREVDPVTRSQQQGHLWEDDY